MASPNPMPQPELPPPDRGLRSAIADAGQGLPVTPALALRMLRCDAGDLPALLQAARDVRNRFKPGTITYSRKVFLPLTNLCRDYCGYCTFRRDPSAAGAHTMPPEEVLHVVREGEKLGCTEALFSLGDKPEALFPEMRTALRRLGYQSTLHYLEAMCELVLRETRLLPHANPGLMGPEWLRRLAVFCPSLGLMLETTSNALLRPGAAHFNAPDKIPARRLATIANAARLGVPFTTGILVGIGETLQDRAEALFAIRALQERYGYIQEFIVQNFRVKREIPMSGWPEPSRHDMLRTVAVARLVLGDMNLQAPPNLSAPDFESLLDAGINDWGGVSPLTVDFINPEAPWPHLELLRQRTEAAGFRLAQRLPVYPEYVSSLLSKPGLLAEKLGDASDARGLARAASQPLAASGSTIAVAGGRARSTRMIVVLTGGTGGAKFVQGIARVRPPEELVFIVNTGDDLSLHGLHISPDVDSITYALAGLLSRERGWGVEADTFHCLDAMRRLGIPGWFQLGDRDLALHLFRTQLLSSGLSLSQATAVIVERLGIRSRILVMSDERVETRVQTNLGELSFQEYFVRERYTPAVQQVQFLGAESALPAPGVVDALLAAEAIVIAPSNPVTSIGPILAVPGIRQALCRTPASIAAISPIVGGAAVSGPAGALMAAQHLPVSIAGVAEAYADFLDVLIADQGDAVLRAEVERLGVRAEFTDTIMKSQSDKERLAGVALELALQPVASS